MELMNKIWEAAKRDRKRIVLPEGEEERNLVASQSIKEKGLADIILVGNAETKKTNAEKLNVKLEGIKIEDPETSDNLSKYVKEFYEIRKNKGMTMEKAEKIVRDPLYYGTMMVKLGDAYCMLSGAIHTTWDLLRP